MLTEYEYRSQGDASSLRLEFTELTENHCTLSFMDVNHTSVKLFKKEPEAHHQLLSNMRLFVINFLLDACHCGIKRRGAGRTRSFVGFLQVQSPVVSSEEAIDRVAIFYESKGEVEAGSVLGALHSFPHLMFT